MDSTHSPLQLHSSCRSVLGNMAAFRGGVLPLLALFLGLVSFAYAHSKTVSFQVRLTWEDWAPAGIHRKIILSNGQFPAPTLKLKQGDDVEFLVINDLPFETTIHFHGIDQAGTPWSDGVPGLSQKPISAGESFLYKWRATNYGSYFYHAHNRGQLEDGLYGAIHILADKSVEKPFSMIAKNLQDLHAMEAAEKKSTPIILSDIRQLTSEEIWNAEAAMGRDAYCANALLVNGKGSVSCLGQQTINQYTSAAQKVILGNASLTDIGCAPPTNALMQGDFPYNASAIPESVFWGCTPSDGSIERLWANPKSKYASYDLINAGGIETITFAIDEHPMYVYAIDGQYIVPTLVDAITIPNGNRYSVLVQLDKPAGDYTMRLANTGVNQILNGTALMSYGPGAKEQKKSSTPYIDITGAVTSSSYTILNESTIVPFTDAVPGREVAATHILTLERYNASYRWTLGNSSFPLALEKDAPLLFYPSTAKKDFTVKTLNGTWVDLIFSVANALQPPHPIHKHSNKFFVIGQGEGKWNYSSVAEAMEYIPESFNLENPQLRDTFVTPAARTGPTWLALRYQVVNPGAFLLHCHIQVHLSGGMAMALLDGIDAWPEIPPEYQELESASKVK
ncbi:hypothetical protein AOCH_006475 [Aspergillus ochraceoroseus]|uniref:Laccase TilA n=1 Tax=Aspergillus ochraceoroseus TaxID=138278 RepID=A0A0F8XN21_9EURO|nr:hypothetical protein AOCH_006475 [Aspergillus ochraceoroseus]